MRSSSTPASRISRCPGSIRSRRKAAGCSSLLPTPPYGAHSSSLSAGAPAIRFIVHPEWASSLARAAETPRPRRDWRRRWRAWTTRPSSPCAGRPKSRTTRAGLRARAGGFRPRQRKRRRRIQSRPRAFRARCISAESMALAHPPPIARRETGVLPDALCGGGQGWGSRGRRGLSNAPTARPPSSILPHKSLRPGARKRGPGGGGDASGRSARKLKHKRLGKLHLGRTAIVLASHRASKDGRSLTTPFGLPAMTISSERSARGHGPATLLFSV